MIKKYNYNTAPLPFQGQKRRFAKTFTQTIKQCPEDAVFVDLFGGSGFLSYLIKEVKPNATVVYNDYDDYHLRLNNTPKTNNLLADIRSLLAHYTDGSKIDNPDKEKIINRIKREEKTEYVDYITISSSLLFSGKYANSMDDLLKNTFYYRVKKTDYNVNNYLDGLIVVKYDYKQLFEQYKNNNKVIFIVDPPYLSTDTTTYNSNSYWKLNNYLDVTNVLKENPFVFFTSSKSSILELCDWININLDVVNPFAGAIRTEINTGFNPNSVYTEIMLSKL